MTFSTMMVNIELDYPNDAILRIAADLAERFNAKLIGIAVDGPRSGHSSGGAFARGPYESFEVKERMSQAEAHFRSALQEYARSIEWRAAEDRTIDYVACQARAADLIITGAKRDDPLFNSVQRLDPSDLVMRVGRPILVVPPEVERLRLKSALVAWKDTREAQRAVADAVPLLQKCQEVAVVEVIEGESDRDMAHGRVDDVTAWLGGHGVSAFGRVFHAINERDQIDQVWRYGADILVAGAYGHGRMHEWAFGGFTRSVLKRSRHCSFLAH